MEVNSKEIKRVKKEIPLDSWGEVMCFLSTSVDFLNLVLSIKGLYYYSQKICPNCTQNIEFYFYRVPWETLEHVSYLKFVNVEDDFKPALGIDHLFRLANFSSWNLLFERFGKKFPNLSRVDIGYLGDIGKRKLEYGVLERSGRKVCLTDLKNENYLRNLKRIRIVYPNDIEFSAKFQKVSELDVRSGMRYFETEETDCVFSLKIGQDSFPSCIKLRVEGFVIDRLEYFQKCLQTLVLKKNSENMGTINHCLILEDFNQLCSIYAKRGVSQISKLKNLPQLKVFECHIHGVINEDLDFSQLTGVLPKFDRIYFENIPNIEEISIRDALTHESEILTLIQPTRKEKFYIMDLKVLRKLNFRVTLKLCVSNIPNISEMEIWCCSAEISNMSSMSRLKIFECDTLYGTKFRPNFEVSNMNELVEFRCVSGLEEDYLSENTLNFDEFGCFKFRSNPKLKTVIVDRILLIDDCLSLTHLKCKVNNGKSFQFSGFIPSLNLTSLDITIEERGRSTRKLEQTESVQLSLQRASSTFSNIMNCTISFGDDLKFRNDSPPLVLSELSLKGIKDLTLFHHGKLVIKGLCSKDLITLRNLTIESDSDITIFNLPKLKSFIWKYGKGFLEGTQPSSVVIENCPCLKIVEFEQCSKFLKFCSFNKVELRNLTSMRIFTIGKNFSGIKSLKIFNSPIRRLNLRIFSKCEPYNRETNTCVFDIDETNFPRLRSVHLETGVSYKSYKFYRFDDQKIMKIGDFIYPSSLKRICLGDVGCRKTGFAREVSEVNKEVILLEEGDSASKSYTELKKTISREQALHTDEQLLLLFRT